ncbi:MAG: hypothetical protein ACKOPS_07435 [Cyanobium sp.]
MTQAQLQLQASLIDAMGGLVELVARLSQQLGGVTSPAAKPATASAGQKRIPSCSCHPPSMRCRKSSCGIAASPCGAPGLDRPYREEEITLLEEDVLPALKGCLARIEELDDRHLEEMEFLARCEGELERFRSAKLRPRLG